MMASDLSEPLELHETIRKEFFDKQVVFVSDQEFKKLRMMHKIQNEEQESSDDSDSDLDKFEGLYTERLIKTNKRYANIMN